MSEGTKVAPPVGLLAELTHRCPLGCPYCSNPIALEGRADELDAATARPQPLDQLTSDTIVSTPDRGGDDQDPSRASAGGRRPGPPRRPHRHRSTASSVERIAPGIELAEVYSVGCMAGFDVLRLFVGEDPFRKSGIGGPRPGADQATRGSGVD